jgi:hypothetical protein
VTYKDNSENESGFSTLGGTCRCVSANSVGTNIAGFRKAVFLCSWANVVMMKTKSCHRQRDPGWPTGRNLLQILADNIQVIYSCNILTIMKIG